jgi:large subunit ribosomal protein L24
MKVKKGDKVLIIKGKDRGKSGAVLNVFSENGRLTIEGLNMIKKRARPKKGGEKGQLINVPSPIKAENVAVICTKCAKPTRVGYKLEGNKKFRICKKCNQEI